MRIRNLIRLAVMGLLGMAIFWGCNSAPLGQDPKSTFSYQIRGTLIQDANMDSSRVVASVNRDNSIYKTAELVFKSDTLAFNSNVYGMDSIYTFSKFGPRGYSGSPAKVILEDSPSFKDSFNINVGDTFSIDPGNFNPANHLVRGLQSVSFSWSGSVNAIGYVMAAVLVDSVYRGYGYSLWSLQPDAGTIPPDAFSMSPGPDPDTGLYYICVYAVTGTPDSALTANLLPVPLPDQRADNIALGAFTGRFGGIQVALWDTVRVQTIP